MNRFTQILRMNKLTRGQAAVTEQLLAGKSNAEIATELKTSEKAVKFHNTEIYKKFGVKSRSELMAKLMPIYIFNKDLAIIATELLK